MTESENPNKLVDELCGQVKQAIRDGYLDPNIVAGYLQNLLGGQAVKTMEAAARFVNTTNQFRDSLKDFLEFLRKVATPGTPDTGVLAQPYDELRLSVRARKTCFNSRVRTIGDLTRKSADDLFEVQGCGEVTLYEIRQKLSRVGLKLRDDDD